MKKYMAGVLLALLWLFVGRTIGQQSPTVCIIACSHYAHNRIGEPYPVDTKHSNKETKPTLKIQSYTVLKRNPHTNTIEVSEENSSVVIGIITIAFGTVTIYGLTLTLSAFIRRPYLWNTQATLKAITPLSILGSVILMFLIASGNTGTFLNLNPPRIVEAVIPLVMGVQAALLFSPEDEPALEVMAACPRGLSWVLIERWGGAVAAQTLVAVGGMILSIVLTSNQDPLIMLTRWISPGVLFSGLAIFITLRSRVAVFGAVITGALWFIFLLFGDFFLPGGIALFTPINYLQPFLWGIYPYLQPDDLSISSYWINRLCVLFLGGSLFTLSVLRLRNEEQLLLGGKKV